MTSLCQSQVADGISHFQLSLTKLYDFLNQKYSHLLSKLKEGSFEEERILVKKTVQFLNDEINSQLISESFFSKVLSMSLSEIHTFIYPPPLPVDLYGKIDDIDKVFDDLGSD